MVGEEVGKQGEVEALVALLHLLVLVVPEPLEGLVVPLLQ